MSVVKAINDQLASLIEELIVKEPFEADGETWAARPQSYYYDKLGVSAATLRRRIAHPPSIRKRKIIDDKIVTLLRLGEAPPKDVADEAKRVMIRLWNKSTGQPATLKQGQCLWGMTKDVMALLDELGLPAEAGGELAIAAFKYAIGKQGWPTVYVHIKVMAQELPDGKVIYLQHPSVSVIRRFWKEVLRVYLEDGHIPPKGGGIDLAWKGSGMKLAMALEEKIYQEIESEEAASEGA